jgi:hypothetical protein
MRPVASDEELKRLRFDGFGYIYNDFARLGSNAPRYNVLHSASCGRLASANTRVDKYFFDNLEEAIAWLLGERGQEGTGWKRCHCVSGEVEGSPAKATKRPAVGIEEEPFREPAIERLLIDHLRAEGYEVETRLRVSSGIIDVVASAPDERLIVEVKGEDAGGYTSAEMNFHIGLAQIASRMTSREASYALAIPDTGHYRRVLRKFAGSYAFSALGARLLVVKQDGGVDEYAPSEIASFIDSLPA